MLGRKLCMLTNHCTLAWLFSKEPRAFAHISGWLANLMEYPIVIEYFCKSENIIADAISRLDSVSVDNEVPNNLARGVPSFACPATQVDSLEARTDWLAVQRDDSTVLFIADLLRRRARLKPVDIELNPQLKPFVYVWPQLVLEDELVKHCNERAVSTQIVVAASLQEEVFRSLHEPAHHGYKETLRRILQRFCWLRVRNDVSALVRAC